MARPAGLEPAAVGFEAHYSIQLSYGRGGNQKRIYRSHREFATAREKGRSGPGNLPKGFGGSGRGRVKAGELEPLSKLRAASTAKSGALRQQPGKPAQVRGSSGPDLDFHLGKTATFARRQHEEVVQAHVRAKVFFAEPHRIGFPPVPDPENHARFPAGEDAAYLLSRSAAVEQGRGEGPCSRPPGRADGLFQFLAHAHPAARTRQGLESEHGTAAGSTLPFDRLRAVSNVERPRAALSGAERAARRPGRAADTAGVTRVKEPPVARVQVSVLDDLAPEIPHSGANYPQRFRRPGQRGNVARD